MKNLVIFSLILLASLGVGQNIVQFDKNGILLLDHSKLDYIYQIDSLTIGQIVWQRKPVKRQRVNRQRKARKTTIGRVIE